MTPRPDPLATSREFSDERADGAALLPFRGVRFREDIPGGLAAVMGPPADLTSSEEARDYVADRPCSAVRLELSDDEHGARFLGARKLFDQWRRDGTLVRDDAEAYYIYEQEFTERGVTRSRRGIFGLAPIDAPETVVLPHEDTWEENLRRRRHILRDIEASLSPILLLHDAPAALLEPHFAAITWRNPSAIGFDDDGHRHRIWVVTSSVHVRAIAGIMQGRRFMIADGHHRYGAARSYHREHRSPESGFIPALCVAQDDPAVILRAIHRVLDCPLTQSWEVTRLRLEEWFDIEDTSAVKRSGVELAARLPGCERPAFGLFLTGDRLFTLRIRTLDTVTALVRNRRTALRSLDVTIATDVVLRHAFRIDPADACIEYTNDADAAVAAVRSGEAAAALLMRPPRIEQVLAVARSHGRMPQKSTSFVPKVPIGLVMHEFLASRNEDAYLDLR